jgi:signal transduction histidine kinase
VQAIVLAGVAAVLVALLIGLPFGADLGRSAGGATGVAGRSLAGALALGSSALLLYAAVAAWQLGAGRRDSGATWLAAGLALLGVAQVYSATLPVLAAGSVSPREPLRVAGILLVVAGTLLAEREARCAAARLAVIAERQRVARDLHDGIAQDLAFIAAHAGALPDAGDAEHPLRIAARRALAVSRGVIDELSDLDGRPFHEALRVLAAELSDRFAISVKIELAHDDNFSMETRHDLVRIVREAVTNAVKHGSATKVLVALERSATGTVLRVRDNGIGMLRDGGHRAPEGFGLTSMRERVAAMGARLAFNEPAGGGTEVEVALP